VVDDEVNGHERIDPPRVTAGSRHRPLQVDPDAPTFERVAKPVTASERELTDNPRARSARLRSAIRTSASPRKERLQ